MLAALAHRIGNAWMRSVESLTSGVWTSVPHPPGRDLINGPGHDPDRVALIGGSVAVGWGVLDHELGFAGHLARRVSALTGRGVDIEVVVDPTMSDRTVRAALTPDLLDRVDLVILTIGTREAFELVPTWSWRAHLVRVLDHIAAAGPSAPFVVVLGTDPVSPVSLPRFIQRIVRRRSVVIDEATRQVVERRTGCRFILSPLAAAVDDEPVYFDAGRRALYDRVASAVAPSIAATLDGLPRGAHPLHDDSRALALDRARERIGRDDTELTRLVHAVRDLLGVSDAVLLFVGEDAIEPIVADDDRVVPVPMSSSFSAVTIQGRHGLVVPDILADARFRERPDVVGPPGLRSYAGYPVQSPDGHRVAVLAVADTRPREFSPSDLALLRGFAVRVAEVVFARRESGEPISR